VSRAARGQDAERSACAYLERRGLVLVERNFRTRRGEIDLVMRQGRDLVFIEVRYRSNHRFGGGLESVDAAKRRRLIAAAQEYLQRHGNRCAARFDVVAMDADGRIDWIRNAFDAG
jgi:putative endonuclease